MEYTIVVFILLLVFTNIKSLIRYRRVKKYLLEFTDKEIELEETKKINIIIPVYHEVKNIEASVKYFKELSEFCDVYYVTTSKEKDMATYNEVEHQIYKQKTQNIFLDNSPNLEGTMADQLNYIAKKLPNDSIIGIYNIDSLPEVNTFKYIIKSMKEKEVYQQVSYFNDNNRGILNSAQNWQNRWSLIYEMGKYLKKTGGNNFIYTIGHGLFLNKNILDKYGYWSQEEINEDNEFGYRLVCNGMQIKPIPYLEKADFANDLKIYIKQQSTWVNGPLYAFSYYRKCKNKNLKNLYLALLNFKAFISWSLFPIAFLCMLVGSLLYSYIYTLIILILMFNYISIYNYLINKLLKKIGYIKNKSYNTNVLKDYMFFVIHCFGSFITIYKIIKNKNNINNKYNTEK